MPRDHLESNNYPEPNSITINTTFTSGIVQQLLQRMLAHKALTHTKVHYAGNTKEAVGGQKGLIQGVGKSFRLVEIGGVTIGVVRLFQQAEEGGLIGVIVRLFQPEEQGGGGKIVLINGGSECDDGVVRLCQQTP